MVPGSTLIARENDRQHQINNSRMTILDWAAHSTAKKIPKSCTDFDRLLRIYRSNQNMNKILSKKGCCMIRLCCPSSATSCQDRKWLVGHDFHITEASLHPTLFPHPLSSTEGTPKLPPSSSWSLSVCSRYISMPDCALFGAHAPSWSVWTGQQRKKTWRLQVLS